MSKELFEKMLAESGWDESCGPFPGVWDDGKPVGERCMWSVDWIGPDGKVIKGSDIEPGWLNSGGKFQIVNNAVVVNDGPRLSARDYADIDREARRRRMKNLSLAGRPPGHEEPYNWPYGPKPANLVMANIRPGWIPAWFRSRADLEENSR